MLSCFTLSQRSCYQYDGHDTQELTFLMARALVLRSSSYEDQLATEQKRSRAVHRGEHLERSKTYNIGKTDALAYHPIIYQYGAALTIQLLLYLLISPYSCWGWKLLVKSQHSKLVKTTVLRFSSPRGRKPRKQASKQAYLTHTKNDANLLARYLPYSCCVLTRPPTLCLVG